MPTPKKSKTTPIVTDRGYAEFIRSLDLRGIGLKACSSTLDRGTFFRLSDKGKPLQRLKEEYRLVQMGLDFFDAEGRFELTVSSKEGDKPALAVECIFTAHIHAAEPVSKEFAKRFAESELWIVMLPYGRYFITDITTRMSIPPIMIPLAARR